MCLEKPHEGELIGGGAGGSLSLRLVTLLLFCGFEDLEGAHQRLINRHKRCRVIEFTTCCKESMGRDIWCVVLLWVDACGVGVDKVMVKEVRDGGG